MIEQPLLLRVKLLLKLHIFRKLLADFCKNVTGFYVFFSLFNIFLFLFEIHCLGIQCTLMISRHNVIQALCSLGIMLCYYELGIQKSRHNVI